MPDIRATCWSLTINNPTPADDECLHLALQKGWKVEGQLEKGVKDGTPHYQMMLRTPQVRFANVKKQFPRAHIEVARNPAALSQYVAKEETREGELPVAQEMYPSQSKFFDLIWDVILADQTDKSEFRRGTNGRFISPKNSLVFATKELIRKGYVVENIACNPMTIQAWTLFHDDFLARKQARVQQPAENVEGESIPTNNADDAAQP